MKELIERLKRESENAEQGLPIHIRSLLSEAARELETSLRFIDLYSDSARLAQIQQATMQTERYHDGELIKAVIETCKGVSIAFDTGDQVAARVLSILAERKGR